MRAAVQLLASCPLNRFLLDHKADTYNSVLVLDVTSTVADALAALAHKRVLSAPLVDKANGRFIGFVPVSDILRAFINSDSEELLVVRHQIGDEGPDAPGARLLAPRQPTGGRFAERTLASIARRGSDGHDGHLLLVSKGEEDAYASNTNLTLLDVVRGAFLHPCTAWPACHRAAIIDEAWDTCRVTNIVSQSDVLRFVHGAVERGELGAALNVSLSSVGLVASDPPPPVEPAGAAPPVPMVACVAGSTPAIDAFGSMLRLGVSALGVVDDRGALAANLSASDVRCVLPDRWGVLALPVLRFLERSGWGGDASHHGGCAARGGGATSTRGAIAVGRHAMLRDAIRALVKHRIHHVFVVDDINRPVGIVTTTDILRLLVAVA